MRPLHRRLVALALVAVTASHCDGIDDVRYSRQTSGGGEQGKRILPVAAEHCTEQRLG